jgi:hypothetical protein
VVEIADPAVDVEIADVLLALARLAGWAVVVGLCAMVVAFVDVLFYLPNLIVSTITAGLVGTLPGLNTVRQFVTNALGSAVAHFDAQVGSFWHGLTTIVSEVAGFVFDTGILLGYLAYYISPAHLAYVVYQHIHGFVASIEKVGVLARFAEREAVKAERIARSVAAGDFAIPRTWVRDVEKALQPEITTTRDLAESATKGVSDLWDYLRTHPWTVATDAFAAAVAVALTSLGLGGLRCPSFLNILKNRGCGAWQGLEDVLGLLVDLFVVTHICDVLPMVDPYISDVAAPLITTLSSAGAGLCKGSIGAPGVLQGAVVTVPGFYTGTPGLPA